MHEMAHVGATSQLHLINSVYTASLRRCRHLTTKTSENITCISFMIQLSLGKTIEKNILYT